MTDKHILAWIAANPLGDAMRSVPWLYPLGQILHFFGLCFLMGAILIVDLRLLGFLKMMTIRSVLVLIPIAIVSFLLNLSTGVAFFVSDPPRFWFNIAFRLKMVAIILAGLNALWFTFGEQRKLLAMPLVSAIPAITKLTAGLSILFWFSVIVLGRLLPVYTP